MTQLLRVGTRASALALTQTELVGAALAAGVLVGGDDAGQQAEGGDHGVTFGSGAGDDADGAGTGTARSVPSVGLPGTVSRASVLVLDGIW